MATLTWRNVDAPDFRGSLQGFAATGDLLNNAAQGVNSAINQIRQQQSQAADSQALSQALRYTNPNDYAAALSNGNILAGINPSNLSDRAFAQLSNRYGDLINAAGAQQKQNQSDYTFNRGVDADRRLDAAEPAISDALSRYASGNYNNPQAIFSDPAIRNLNPNMQANLLSSLTGIEDSNLTRQNTITNMNRSNQAYNDNQAGTNLGMSVAPNVLNLNNGIATIMASPNYSDAAKQSAIRWLQANQNAIGSTGVANPLVIKANETTYGNGSFGQPSANLSGMTIGQRQDYGNQQIDLTKGKINAGPNQGTSALGPFQLTNATIDNYAPKVLGSDYKNSPNSAENNYKVAEAVWNDNAPKGNAINVWPSLKGKLTTEQAKTMPFSEIAPFIIHGETGLPLQSAQQVASSIQGNFPNTDPNQFNNFDKNYGDINTLLSEGSNALGTATNNQSYGGLLQAVASSRRNFGIDPTTGQTTTNGNVDNWETAYKSFPEADRGILDKKLNEFMQQTKSSLPEAVAALHSSLTKASSLVPYSLNPNSIDKNESVDPDAFKAAIKNYNSPDFQKALMGVTENGRTQANMGQIMQSLAAKRQAVLAALPQLQRNPALAPQVKSLVDDYKASESRATGILNSIQIK